MNTKSLLAASWEIKRPYQINVVIGFGISGLLHLVIVTLVVALNSSPPPLPPIIIDSGPGTVIFQPPTILDGPLPKRVNTDRALAPDIGKIYPVPDKEAPENVNIPSQAELGIDIPSMPVDYLDDNVVINTQKVADELLPPPGSFTPCDVWPVAINSVQPEYPDLARRAGIEGTIWLEVLIDKNGNVLDVNVVKSTNKNAGFEEPAVAAAWKSVWKPAIANGLPIAVRVTYSVVFKLK